MRWPRTLFGRNFLLIVGLILVGQITTALVFLHYAQRPRIEMLAVFAAGQIGTLDATLRSLPAAERAQLRDKINRAGSLQVQTGDFGGTASAPLWNPYVRVFVAALQRQFGDRAALRWQADADGKVQVALHVNGSPYWFRMSDRLVSAPFSTGWLGSTVLYALLALIGAYLIQQRINRPLLALADAAEKIGKGEVPAPLSDRAPDEIAAVIRSFSQMTRSLARQDEERAIMLAGVSHDLRTPLTKLQLGIALLEGQHDADLTAGMVRHVEEINAVIAQFVDFARSGSDEPEQAGELNPLIVALAAEHAQRGSEFALALAPLPPMLFRPIAMRRLLTNLMTNAQCYGKVGLSVTTEVLADGCRINVLDRGPGIAPMQIEAVLQPFVRGDAVRGTHSGAGLGLAIVDRIARLHGGWVQLQPRDGGGLHVSVYLPDSRTRPT